MIIINFKAYTESMGIKGLRIAKICEKVSRETSVLMAIAPQMCDLAWMSREISIPVFAQHVDAIEPGSRTGLISPEAIKIAGAAGTLLNHSEHPMKIADIRLVIGRCRQLGLVTCVCASDVKTIETCAVLRPDYVAIEPPELIGGAQSVVEANPEAVRKAVNSVRMIDEKIKVLCGAGITDAADVAKALSLGTQGILIASGIVKSKHIEKTLRAMANEFRT
ncbi:MAG: triose-phosphate isomerase [Candidatus Bathyarchaeota archaeon]